MQIYSVRMLGQGAPPDGLVFDTEEHGVLVLWKKPLYETGRNRIESFSSMETAKMHLGMQAWFEKVSRTAVTFTPILYSDVMESMQATALAAAAVTSYIGDGA